MPHHARPFEPTVSAVPVKDDRIGHRGRKPRPLLRPRGDGLPGSRRNPRLIKGVSPSLTMFEVKKALSRTIDRREAVSVQRQAVADLATRPHRPTGVGFRQHEQRIFDGRGARSTQQAAVAGRARPRRLACGLHSRPRFQGPRSARRSKPDAAFRRTSSTTAALRNASER
jgi:hypothetical protein